MKIVNQIPNCRMFTCCISTVLTLLFLSGVITTVQADGNLSIIKVNKVVMGVYDHGSTWRQTPSYSSGWFPADYNCQGLDCSYSPSFGPNNLAAINWYGVGTEGDNEVWKVWPKATFSPYTSSYEVGDIVIQPMTNYVRWQLPENYANGENVQVQNIWGTPNASNMIGTSDQVVEVVTENIHGINIHRKIFAWSQENHDDYVITDFTITNNSDSTLNDFYLSMRHVFHGIARSAGGNPEIPSGQRPSRLPWGHYYGAKPEDTLRIYYEYSADDPELTGDQMGSPVYTQDGRLSGSDIHFFTVLHASGEPYIDPNDDVDDPIQPTVTGHYNHERVTYSPSPGEPPGSSGYDVIAGLAFTDQEIEGQYEGTHHRQNNDEQGDPDYTNLGNGFDKSVTWNSRNASFGPYESFEPGESIHVIYATGICGLGLKKAKEIGKKWLNDTLDEPPGLPNAQTGYFPENFAFPTDATGKDKTKDRWISTVIDSVHQAASRAKWNFEHDWQVPMAPPPTNQSITGTGAGIEIGWSNPDAEDLDNFDGYRIMRSIGYSDTIFFEEVLRTDAADKQEEHHWTDPSVRFGATYYYYVQVGVKVDENDMNAHPKIRGKTLWSGRMWSTTYNPVESERLSQSDLDKIRIVPNPYNLKDPLWPAYGPKDPDDPRRIMFFNLPDECTIKIFTENLDLVKTIEHDVFPVSTGFEWWDMLTTNQQAIASGVYIVVFQTPDGKVSYQKLLVAR